MYATRQKSHSGVDAASEIVPKNAERVLTYHARVARCPKNKGPPCWLGGLH